MKWDTIEGRWTTVYAREKWKLTCVIASQGSFNFAQADYLVCTRMSIDGEVYSQT